MPTGQLFVTAEQQFTSLAGVQVAFTGVQSQRSGVAQSQLPQAFQGPATGPASYTGSAAITGAGSLSATGTYVSMGGVQLAFSGVAANYLGEPQTQLPYAVFTPPLEFGVAALTGAGSLSATSTFVSMGGVQVAFAGLPAAYAGEPQTQLPTFSVGKPGDFTASANLTGTGSLTATGTYVSMGGVQTAFGGVAAAWNGLAQTQLPQFSAGLVGAAAGTGSAALGGVGSLSATGTYVSMGGVQVAFTGVQSQWSGVAQNQLPQLFYQPPVAWTGAAGLVGVGSLSAAAVAVSMSGVQTAFSGPVSAWAGLPQTQLPVSLRPPHLDAFGAAALVGAGPLTASGVYVSMGGVRVAFVGVTANWLGLPQTQQPHAFFVAAPTIVAVLQVGWATGYVLVPQVAGRVPGEGAGSAAAGAAPSGGVAVRSASGLVRT